MYTQTKTLFLFLFSFAYSPFLYFSCSTCLTFCFFLDVVASWCCTNRCSLFTLLVHNSSCLFFTFFFLFSSVNVPFSFDRLHFYHLHLFLSRCFFCLYLFFPFTAEFVPSGGVRRVSQRLTTFLAALLTLTTRTTQPQPLV